jgi:hypothetical protein
MNPSDYRRDFAAYHSALARERFNHHAGFSPRPDIEPVEERHADLWTREAIEDLSRALEETPAHFETERAGLGALAGAARLKHAEACAREMTGELRRCAGAARVEWGGAKVAAEDVPELLADESDAARRRELSHRWFDALGPCEDLRAARLDAIGEAARGLGLAGVRSLYESSTGVNLQKLAADAELFLSRTERAYMTQLSRWASREITADAPRELEFADGLFFGRASHLDSYFRPQSFGAVYAETLAGLGVRAGSQQNLQLDAAPRAAKGAWSACFAVEPPADVRLVLGARGGGASFFRQTFKEAGRAQMFAWASRETASRYPEFVRAPDAATEEGHARLLAGLFRDAAWLGEHRGVRATAAQEVARSVALVELHDARRDCAALRHALALDAATDPRSEQLAESYVSQLTAATGFKYDAATRLLGAQDLLATAAPGRSGAAALFLPATLLRARLFAAAFVEHLRARHGRRWFASRAAGDELIDVWNTASRHSVEELARLVWGGELSFELLADVLSAEAEG